MTDVALPTLEMALSEAARWVAAGNYEQAIARCNELNAAYPDAVRVVRLRAQAQELSGNPVRAIEDYTRALDVLPADVGLMVGLARCQQKAEQFSEAAVSAQQALAHDPRDADALRIAGDSETGLTPPGRAALARTWFTAGLTNRALAEMKRLIQAEPDRTDLQVVLAEMLWRAGLKVTTVELCNTILDEEPDCLNAHVILSALWTRMGSATTAQAHEHAAGRLDPDFHATRDWLGNATPLPVRDVPAQPARPAPAAEFPQKEEENSEELDRSAWVDELIAAAGPVTPGVTQSTEDDSAAEVETITPLEWAPAHEGLPDEVPAWLTALRTQPIKTEAEMSGHYVLDESLPPPSGMEDAARVVSITRWSPDKGEQVPQPSAASAPPEGTKTAAPSVLPETSAAPAPAVPAAPEVELEISEAAAVSPDDTSEHKRSRKSKAMKNEDLLSLARQALEAGQYEQAAGYYHSLIAAEQKLDVILADLDRVTHRVSPREHPEVRRLHALLGDVYTRKGEINAALMAYHRALEKE